MTNADLLTEVDVQLQGIEAEIGRLTQLLADAEAKRTDLQATKRVLGQIYGTPKNGTDLTLKNDGTTTISAEIKHLLNKRGPQTKAEVHEYLEKSRDNISLTTVSTTLSRMKQKGEVDNRDGKWIAI